MQAAHNLVDEFRRLKARHAERLERMRDVVAGLV